MIERKEALTVLFAKFDVNNTPEANVENQMKKLTQMKVQPGSNRSNGLNQFNPQVLILDRVYRKGGLKIEEHHYLLLMSFWFQKIFQSDPLKIDNIQ